MSEVNQNTPAAQEATALQPAQPRPLKLMIKDEEVQARFKQILGDGSPAFLMSVLNCVQNSDKLKNAEPQTILMAAAVAATLKLPIDPNLGLAYIIPYNEKIQGTNPPQWRTVAQFQIGYKGIIELCHRTKDYVRINAIDVRQGELVYTDFLSGDISYEWVQDLAKREALPIIGYVAYFRLANGFEKQFFMPIDKIEAHARKYSKTYKNGTGIWAEDKDDMSKKTVLKLLLGKFGPKSVDIIKAITTDQAVIEDYDGKNVRYLDNPSNDNNFIPLQENNQNEIRARVRNHIANSKTVAGLRQCEADVDDETRDEYNAKLAEISNKK